MLANVAAKFASDDAVDLSRDGRVSTTLTFDDGRGSLHKVPRKKALVKKQGDKKQKQNLEKFKNLFPAKNITLIERTENGKFVCVKKHNSEALDDTPQNDTISKGSDPVYVAGRLSKTQITPGFMACFDAQPVEIVQHSASSAADRDFEFFSKTKSIKYEKRGNDSVKRLSDRRDGMKNEDIILAIAARVPKSPFEAPLADRVDDSRDVDDYSVTIHIDMKLVKFTKSGKIEQKSLGFTFGPSNAAELLDLKGEIFAVAPVHTAANPPPKTAISSEAPTMGEARVASSMAVGGILLAERQLKKGYILKEIKPKGQDPIDVSQKDSDGVEEVLIDLQRKTDVSTHVELVFDMMLDLTSTNTDFLDFWEKKDDYIKKGEVRSNQSWHPTTFAAVLEIIIKAYPQKKKPLLLGESMYATAQALDIPGGGRAAAVHIWRRCHARPKQRQEAWGASRQCSKSDGRHSYLARGSKWTSPRQVCSGRRCDVH